MAERRSIGLIEADGVKQIWTRNIGRQIETEEEVVKDRPVAMEGRKGSAKVECRSSCASLLAPLGSVQRWVPLNIVLEHPRFVVFFAQVLL